MGLVFPFCANVLQINLSKIREGPRSGKSLYVNTLFSCFLPSRRRVSDSRSGASLPLCLQMCLQIRLKAKPLFFFAGLREGSNESSGLLC